MLSVRLVFCSSPLRKQILTHIYEGIQSYDDVEWWKLNECLLMRELKLIASKKNVAKIIYHAKHYDPYYLAEVFYELGMHVK